MKKTIENYKQKTYNFLRWIEKWTKTDMVYLAKGGSWLTFGQIFSSASAFLLAIAFASLVPKEIYGNYKYILSIAGILSIPTLAGIDTAIVQSVARGFDGSLIKALQTKIKWGLLGSFASIILAGYYYFNENLTLAVSFLIISVFIPLMDSFGLYGAFLSGKKEFKISSIYGNIIQAVSILSMITTIFFTDNIFVIILVYFSSYTFMRALFFKKTINKFPPNDEIDTEIIPYGKHLSLVGIFGTVAMQIDKILIFHYLGAAQLAIYFFALAVPSQIKSLFKSMNTLALPKFSEKSKVEIRETIYPKIFKFAMVLSIVAIFYILSAPLIYEIFFPQYLDSVIYSQIFSITIVSMVSFIPASILRSQKMTKEIYKMNIYTSIFQIILLFVMINFYGLMGAVVSRVLTTIFTLILSLTLINK